MENFPEEPLSSNANSSDEIARLVAAARAHWARRTLADSEAPLRRALVLAEESVGPDDPLVAWVLNHLGWLATVRERHAEALSDYRRALTIQEASLGPSHPDTLHTLEELADSLFRANARDAESDELAVRAIRAYDAAGRDDPDFAGLIARVGWRRFWIGRYAEAEPLLLRGLAMRERLLGPGDPATANNAQVLAVMYDTRGFDVDPEPFYRKALVGFEEGRADDHIDVAEARYRLADYLQQQGRDDEAAPLFERLIETLDATGPTVDSAKVYWMLGGCCRFLRDAGREDEAEAIEDRARSYDVMVVMTREDAERAESAFGPDSPELVEVLDNLVNCYVEAGKAEAAAETANRILAILSARLGADDPSTVEAAARLANIGDSASRITERKPDRRGLHHGKWGGELFDAFTFPWRDERRPDLIRAYLTAVEADDQEEGEDESGAVEAITALTFIAELEEQWSVILELIAGADDDDDRVLQVIAAGPLEGFLGRFDGEVIDRVDSEAKRDPRFHRVVSGVWKHTMSDPVWERVRALQATVSKPLLEMHPFTEAEPPASDDEGR